MNQIKAEKKKVIVLSAGLLRLNLFMKNPAEKDFPLFFIVFFRQNAIFYIFVTIYVAILLLPRVILYALKVERKKQKRLEGEKVNEKAE